MFSALPRKTAVQKSIESIDFFLTYFCKEFLENCTRLCVSMDSSTKKGFGVYAIVLFNENGEKYMFSGRESNDHTAKGQAEVIIIS